MINEFYVITAGKNGSDKSLYKVGINVDDPDFPSIEKIAQAPLTKMLLLSRQLSREQNLNARLAAVALPGGAFS